VRYSTHIGKPPAPFIVPTNGTLDQRLAEVALAINRKADVTATPTYGSLVLIDPTGAAWQITVDATGALHTTQVPP
jgi:hypothetical protein